MVEMLIKYRADISVKDNDGRTALNYAIWNDNEKMVDKLTECSDVNAKDEYGATALFYAVDKRNERMVEKLTKYGANVNATNKDGETPLLSAIRTDNNKMLYKLIECGADINSTDEIGKTTLLYAIVKGNESVIRSLIDAGADVNKTDNEGKTALFYAVQLRDNESVVRALTGAGADVNITDNEGKTALFYAVQLRDNESVVRALIDAGADVNITDNEGKTALFFVNSRNRLMAQMLIDEGAQVDVRDCYGRTPLFYAIIRQSLSLAKYLLDKEASLYLNENCSVLTFFIEKCFFSLPGRTPNLQDGLNLLNKRKEVERKQILEAIASVAFCKILYFKPGSCDIDVDWLSELMRLAKQNVSNLNVKTNKTIREISTIITKECHDKRLIESRAALELIRLLDRLGAKPSTTDSDGKTALHHATLLSFHGVTQQCVIEICEQLQKLNVSFQTRNHRNETPLIYCLTRTIESLSRKEEPWPDVKTQAAVCRFLVEHGSSVEAKTNSGETVLHLTIKLLQEGLVKCNNELRKYICEVVIELLEVFELAFRRQDLSTNIPDKSGNTPLHFWAKLQLASGQDYSRDITTEYTFENLERSILALILQNREQLNSKNENGETPLHLCRTWAAVELLLNAGANPNVVDSSGRTPFLVAARNDESVLKQGSLYPDVLMAPNKFWRTVLDKGLIPWTAHYDRHGDSFLNVLMTSDSNELARALVNVACDKNSPANPSLLFSLLTAICKDKSPNAQWKEDAAEMILSSFKSPVNGNDNEYSPLHYCCRNIVEASKSLSTDEIKTTVHWRIVKLLRSHGADYRIPDVTGKTSFEIAAKCPALKKLLKEPIDLDKFPKRIKNWNSVSKIHERYLQQTARHLESKHVQSFWYYKDHLASGSFGAVFAGINEKDGREVAIKRIEKRHMQRPEDKREITNLIALADCEQVVRYLSFFGDENFSFIVLELMEGNIDELLDHMILVNIRVQLCQDVVKGLTFLHDHQFLHRDLKPANILYKYHPKLCLKIADFGLSRRIDCTSTTTVYGTHAGTRCWIASEVLTSTKPHSKSSDVFACGLVLHYILSERKHPFAPRVGALQHLTEANISNGNMEGWDDSLCPEATHLLKAMLDGDESKRASADKALHHPFFWSKKEKLDLLTAVGNQPEFECPRARRTLPLTTVETDLETSYGTIVKYVDWNDPRYAHMPAIYTEMKKKRKGYDTCSVVKLVRFIRNAYAHVSESTRPLPMRKQLLEDFVFLEYFPNLVMEVYKAVTTHEWDQTRDEIKHALK